MSGDGSGGGLTGRKLAWLIGMALPALLGPLWVGVGGWLAGSHWLGSMSGLVLALVLMTSAATDLAHARIPNWATYPAFLWGLGINSYASLWVSRSHVDLGLWPLGAVGIGAALAGSGIGFAVMFLLYRLSGGGAGDVKLAAAIGSLVGPERMIDVLLNAYLAAGAVILSWAVLSIGPGILLASLGRRVGSQLLPRIVAAPRPEQMALLRSPIRLAPFFAIGGLAEALGLNSWGR